MTPVHTQQIQRLLVYGQLSFFAGLVVAVLLRPDGLTSNHGISFYGAIGLTAAPLALGVVLLSIFLWRARGMMPRQYPWNMVRTALVLLVVCGFGIVATPTSWGYAVSWLHTTFGATLFVAQLVLIGWFAFFLLRTWWLIVLWLVQFLAGVLCYFSLNEATPYMIHGQVVFQIVFAVVLVCAVGLLGKKK